uniref:VWFA domain-containing protein n=2 Tax=Caenorhabditis tropicalis TaxID=1561998 RepID=A0A1I7T5K7_9PELO
MLIAGSVMLAVAIASIPPMPPFDDFPTTTSTPTIQPVVIFTTSVISGVTWNPDYANSNSVAFQTLATAISTNISAAYSNPGSQFGSSPLTTNINVFTQSTNGVNFYAELIFPDSSATIASVTAALTSLGYTTDAFTSSTSQCSGLIPPTSNPSSNPSSNPVSLGTTTPMHYSAYCDASNIALTNVFLVDVSVPIIGTVDDKLSKIANYLNNAPSLVNLENNLDWNGQEFRLVVYGANEPTPMGRARNQQSWSNILTMLNSSVVNPTNMDGHQLTDALRFVYNNYRPTPGVAGNIIVVADGFDFDEAQSVNTIANALKSQFYFSLGIILMSTSQAQQGVIMPLATDFGHFYPIENVDYLSNTAVLQTQAQWICDAYYPTPAPPTPPPTRLPLVTTVGTTTNTGVRTTINPLFPPVASCKLNVLFLIDQSQSLLLNGYNSAIQFCQNSATTLAGYNSQTTFAYIVFNGVIIQESNEYTDLQTFLNSLGTVPQTVGTSDVTVGFNEALNFIQTRSQYNDDSVTSLLYYITDGNDYNNRIPNVINTTLTIRSLLQTEIIGIDLIETSRSKANVQKTIQYGTYDGNIQSIYVGVNQPADVLNPLVLNSTNYQMTCKGFSNCFNGLTFVIETSQAEGSQLVDVETKAVLNILSYYQSQISPFKLSISLIYFSAPDNLVPNQSGQSAVLLNHVTDGVSAINTLNTTNFPLGAASDLQLGFSMAAENLRDNHLESENLVIFFARGAYEKLSNCCPDPTADAEDLRKLATVQGVVIGPYSNKNQLDSLTGSDSIDANAIIGNSPIDTIAGRATAAKNISDAIIPVIQKFFSNQYCLEIPPFVNPPCEDPIDTLILLHADDRNNWNSILNFTANQLIPDLLGVTGTVSSRTLTTSTPVNFAIASYYYLDVIIHADFTYLLSPSGYMNLISSINFRETKGTATLSTAYKKAIEIFQDGRQFASKNLILITDTMDISDMENAFSEHDAMVQLVGGYTSALTINTNIIPGADYQINVKPGQLNGYNKYSMRQIANSLTKHTCVYLPLLPTTQPPAPPTPTLPGPIPVVKARNVWPDLTILVDTSSNSVNPMTDVFFEKIRVFLDILLIKYSIGEAGTRVTLATSSSSFSQELINIQRKGVRTISIGLSSNISSNDLSMFAQTSFMVPDWNSSYTGIDSNYDLADRIYQMTTKKRFPSSSNFYANLIFIVDQSASTYSYFNDIVQFVSDSDVDQYLSVWNSSLSPSSATANVGNAISYVSTMLHNDPSPPPTHVVYVVGATNLTGASNKLLGGYNLYVVNYKMDSNFNFTNLVNDQNSFFSVSTSSDLRNKVVSMDVSTPNQILAFNQLLSDTQESADKVTFPISSIAADIVCLLDETGLSDTDFTNVKSFLQDFTSKFTVGSTSTQFALQTYNGRTIPHDGFHLFESTSNDVVKQRIQQLTLAKATENSTDADLAGAIEQEIFFFLTEYNGWRDDTTTYSIIFSHADSFFTRDTDTAMQVKNVSSVFALGLNGQTFPYVRNFTNTGFYETVDNASSLSITSPAVQDLLTTLGNDYRNYVYPTTYDVVKVVKADFIFLIDNALGSSFTPNIKQFFE